jgi:hypothetical protein
VIGDDKERAHRGRGQRERDPDCRRACTNVFALLAGSGEEQASAKLCRVEFDEVAVAFGPPT